MLYVHSRARQAELVEPMRTVPLDTSPEAHAAQVDLLRRATPARRFALMRSLTAHTISLARRAIQRARPELSEQEVLLEFVALHYGRELADAVRRHLAARLA